jgi:WD40 repeat protein
MGRYRLFVILILSILIVSCLGAQEKVQPRFMIPVKHTHGVQAVFYSPDGRLIVTASMNRTTIWDAELGVQLFSLEENNRQIASVKLSPDGRFLLSASYDDGTAKLWDTETGKLVQKFDGHYSELFDASISSDNRRIVTSTQYGGPKMWDTESGEVLYALELGDSVAIHFASFSPNGRLFVTATSAHYLGSNGRQEGIAIWDTESGTLISTLEGDFDRAVFSVDSRKVLVVSLSGFVGILDIESGELLHVFEGHDGLVLHADLSQDGHYAVTASADKTAKLWDASTVELVHTFVGHSDEVRYAAFSPNGQFIVTASADKTARLWDTSSGELIHTLEGHSQEVNYAAFSPDGRHLVTASDDDTVLKWDVESGKLVQCLDGLSSGVIDANFSNDGRFIIISSGAKYATIWDTDSWEVFNKINGNGDNIFSADFSSNGHLILSTSDSTASIWDAKTGKLKHVLNGHSDYVGSAKFSPNCHFVLTFSDDQNTILWNVESGKLCKKWTWGIMDAYSANFGPDSRSVIGIDQKSAVILDTDTGELINEFKVDSAKFMNSLLISPDGSFLVAFHYDEGVSVFNPQTGKLLFNFDIAVESAKFSPDSRLMVSVLKDDGKVLIWDTENWEIYNTLEEQLGHVTSAFFTPDGQQIISVSQDGIAGLFNVNNGNLITKFYIKGGDARYFPDNKLITKDDAFLHFYDLETGTLLYSFIAFDNDDYLILHPDGYYDGTETALNFVYFVCNREVIDLSQMKDALYVPGLLEKIKTGEKINYPKLSELDICDALPIVTRLDEKAYTYTIRPRRLPLERAEVYVNDKLIFSLPVNQLSVKDNSFELVLDEKELEKHLLVGELNKVKVIGVVNSENGSELRSRGIIVPVEKDSTRKVVPPRLFAVMIGINDYKDPALKLNFPVKDAQDLGSALEAAAVKLLGRDNVFMYPVHSAVKPGTGFTTPEKAGIKRALEDIGKKARPEDIVFMFFAGHGEMQGADGKVFTFLTADASKYNPIGISTKELQDWLSYEGPHKMLANKTILIFDACNSGQATQELLTLARNDDDTRRIRQVEDLKDKSGMFILAGSAPNQSAYEMPSFQQGLLTYSLLSVLKSNPEVLDDGKYLNVQKWFLESERTLKKLIESQGLKQDAKPFGTANIRIGIVDEDVTGRISLAKEKPMIICDNVLNNKSFSDELQLKRLINSELSVLSERGSENALLFVKQDAPNANKINVSYEIQGDQVVCQIRLIKGIETRHCAMVSGPQSDLSRLVKQIIDEVLPHAR